MVLAANESEHASARLSVLASRNTVSRFLQLVILAMEPSEGNSYSVLC